MDGLHSDRLVQQLRETVNRRRGGKVALLSLASSLGLLDDVLVIPVPTSSAASRARRDHLARRHQRGKKHTAKQHRQPTYERA